MCESKTFNGCIKKYFKIVTVLRPQPFRNFREYRFVWKFPLFISIHIDSCTFDVDITIFRLLKIVTYKCSTLQINYLPMFALINFCTTWQICHLVSNSFSTKGNLPCIGKSFTYKLLSFKSSYLQISYLQINYLQMFALKNQLLTNVRPYKCSHLLISAPPGKCALW